MKASVAVGAGLMGLALTFPQGGRSADLPPGPPIPPSFTPPPSASTTADYPQMWTSTLYDPTKWELRGGAFVSVWRPEIGTFDVNGELVLPKFYTVPGIIDVVIPRVHVGGMGNLDGGTSYAYAGLLWTLNYTEHLFGEIFVGGAIHDGQLNGPNPNLSSLGCRELIHTGASFGYRIDKAWSAMVTFDHLSNGEPTLSDCPTNQSINILGLRVANSL